MIADSQEAALCYSLCLLDRVAGAYGNQFGWVMVLIEDWVDCAFGAFLSVL
jgi:hypothetical protein